MSAQYRAGQSQPRNSTAAPTGTVLRYQKPADSTTPVAAAAERPTGSVPPSPVDAWTPPPVRPAPASAVEVPLPAGYTPVATKLQEKKPDEQKATEGQKKTEDELEKADRDKYVKLPPLSDVFAFPDDAQLERAILERLRNDERNAVPPRDPYNKYPKGLTFPPGPLIGAGVAYVPKTGSYPPMRAYHEPLYLVHRRLHFEEKNSERYGWDLGFIQPFVSTAFFYKDVLLWPNSLMSGVAYGFWDTNVGKCLPGSPTPYMLYPPGLTITGSVVEGLFITGVAFAVP